MIKVAVEEITERIRYTFDFIFLSNSIAYQFVLDDDADLNYTRSDRGSFDVADLLYETGIKEYQLNNGECFEEFSYEINGKQDPVATVFYILSRYEEYLVSERDKHGRFEFKNSSQYKFGVLEKAVVDRLARAIVLSVYPAHQCDNTVTVSPTFDIDNVYAYKLKTGIRKMGSQVRDILKRDKKRIEERSLVKKGARDPYDTYDRIKEIARQFPSTMVFWLSGGDSKYDRNVNIYESQHSKLIFEINQLTTVGLHPSYSSFNNTSRILGEKLRLEKVMNDQVVHSRFHFLRFSIPESYRALIAAGIINDYSMGYAGHCGFRAGTAKPFLWFDLQKEQITTLRIYPFTYMDGTLNEYMKLSIEEAKTKVSTLYNEVAICGGNMIAIWHNETIGDYNHWKGWGDVLNYNLQLNE
ncbi:MAG: polysaccharide deacetylase family protein [Crocinitomicaceae bacterium]